MPSNHGILGSSGFNPNGRYRTTRRSKMEGLEKRLLLHADVPQAQVSTLAPHADVIVTDIEALWPLDQRSRANQSAGPLGPLVDCHSLASLPSDGSGCSLTTPHRDNFSATGPSGPIALAADMAADVGSGQTGTGQTGTSWTGTGTSWTGTGQTGTGQTGCDEGTNSNGDGTNNYPDQFRYLTVAEGVETEIEVTTLASLPGSTPYAPRSNVEAWYAQRPWAAGGGQLEFVIVANGIVGDGAPRQLLLDRFDNLSADNQPYEKLGTWRRSSDSGDALWPHESYQTLFTWEDRYFVQVNYDIYGGPGSWCNAVLPSSIVIEAKWFDLTQYQFRIDWYDGRSGVGWAHVAGDGLFAISGLHTYEWNQPNRPYFPWINIYTQSPYGWQLRGSQFDWLEVTVPDASHWIDESEQQATVDGEVVLSALLVDLDPLSATYDYEALIDWGDGSSSLGQLVASATEPGRYTIKGFHVYNTVGWYTGTIRATASDGTSVEGHFTVDITTLRPGADPNQYTLLHDRSLSANLLFNQGASGRTVTLETSTTQGSLLLNANGDFTYQPNPRFVGHDSFAYRIWENGIPSFPITITLLVTNHAPLAGDDTWYVSHDRRFAGRVFGNDYDVDGDPFSATAVTPPMHGEFVMTQDGRFEYLPAPGFQGIDHFTYRLSDGLADSDLATVALTVGNRLPPLVLEQQYTVRHDWDLVQTWPHLDPDGDVIQPAVQVQPQHGTVVFDTTGKWTYTPRPSFVGPDSFSFSLYDGLTESETVVVSIEVINHRPVAEDDFYRVSHDQELRQAAAGIFTNDSDADGDALSASLVENVKHGRLEIQADGGFVYLPEPLYVGQDSFRYVLSDGIDSSPPILVSIEVEEHAPQAHDLSFPTWPHDQTLIDDLNRTVTDADQDELWFVLESPPEAGTLVLHPQGQFAYSPPPGMTGSVTFSYRVSDPLLMSDVATVSINVVQNLPTAHLTSHTQVAHDRVLQHNVLANVQDLDQNEYLSFQLVSGPTHGTIAFNSDGNYSYRPHPGFVSQGESQWDSFTYQASDGRGQTAVVRQTIDVQNRRPIVARDEYALPHNKVLSAALGAGGVGGQAASGSLLQRAPKINDYDADGDRLTFYLVDPLSGLEATVASLGLQDKLTWNADGTFLFNPGPRGASDVEFYYAATDGLTSSLPAQILIHVQDTPPVARDDTYYVVHNLQLVATRNSSYLQATTQQVASLVANDTNWEEDSLTATLIDPATGLEFNPQAGSIPGTLQWNGDGTFVYQPELGFSGDIELAYRLSDGVNQSNLGLLAIRVARPGPTAQSDQFVGWHDVPINGSVAVNDSAHGNQLVFELLDASGQVVAPTGLGLTGTLNWSSDGSFTYTPPANWVGSDTFRYRIFDGLDTSLPAIVQLQVENEIPRVTDSWRRVVPGHTYSATNFSSRFRAPLLHGLTDREQDALQAIRVSDVQHGTLQLFPNGEFQYTPAADFRGIDGFTYSLSDGLSSSSIGQVVFNVSNQATQAIDDTYQAYTGIQLVGNVTYNDIDLDGDPIHATLLDATTLLPVEATAFNAFGNLQWNDYGGFEFTAAETFQGTFRFAYLATDQWEGTDIAYVEIVVGNPQALNRPPVARNDTLSVSPGKTLDLPTRAAWDGNVRRMPIGFNDRDPENDSLTFQLVTAPTTGTLTLNPDGSLAYTSAAGNGAQDFFQYQIFDGVNVSNVATVTLNIINHAPVTTNGRFETAHDQSLTGSLLLTGAAYASPALAVDDDRDPLSCILVTTTENGALTLLPSGDFTYTPVAGFVGWDRFTFQVSDGSLSSQVATVVISVINDRPQAFSKSFQLGQHTQLVNQVPPFSSRDNDQAEAVLAGGPFYGSVSLLADGSFSYTPPANFVGRDTFTYYWRDIANGSTHNLALSGNFARITIEVMSRAAVATSDVFHLSFGQTSYELDVLANDFDPAGQGLSITSFTAPASGQLAVLANGKLLYTPHNPNIHGSDRFFYQVQAAGYASLSTAVQLNIAPLRLTADALPLQAHERQEMAFQLANLETTIPPTSVTDFVVNIAWGDGQQTSGTLVPAGNSFQVNGTHVYPRQGSYSATITVKHVAGHQVSIHRAVEVLNTPAHITSQDIYAIKGLPFQAVLATLLDDADADPASYTALIDWGDGQQSPGLVRRVAAGKLEVYQGHMYSSRGTFAVSLLLTDRDGSTQTLTSSAIVSHVVTVQGLAAPLQGREVDGLVGRFTSSSIAAQANQFIATIDWGDGTSSPGMIVGQNGRFDVHGQHRYARLDTYRITLLVTEDDPSQTVVQAEDKVEAPGSTVRVLGRNLEIVEGQQIEMQQILADFIDSDDLATATQYSVTIDWGNGLNSPGTVTGAAGQFQIVGQHRYKQIGAYNIKFSVDKADSPELATGVSSLLVTGAPLVGTAHTITQAGMRELIATFVDPAAGSGFAGRIRLAPGRYQPVEVQTTPAASVITLADGQPSSEAASSPYERQRLTINNSPQGGTFNLRFDGEVTAALPYNASDSEIQAALNALSTIDQVWVRGGAGTFTITFAGAHAFENVPQIIANGSLLTGGQHQVSVFADTRLLPPGELEIQIYQGTSSRLTITSTFAPPAASSGNSTESHPPANLPSQLAGNGTTLSLIEATGVTISAAAGTSFNGTVAKVLGDSSGWEAEINWGDGETSAGAIDGDQVIGSHTYGRPGTYRIAVALRKPDPVGTTNYDPWYYNSFVGPGEYWAWNQYGRDGWYYYPWWNTNSWQGSSWRQGDSWVGGVVSGASIHAPTLSVTPESQLTADVNESLSNIQLLTTNASDRALTVIEWGDNRTSPGTIAEGALKGSHTYTQPGFYTARITLRDGDQLSVSTVPIDVLPRPAWPEFIEALDPGPVRGVEQRELLNVSVAKFKLDTPRRIGGLHQANIDWGDGHQSLGKIESVGSGNVIVVKGTHTYREAGAYDIAVTLLEQALTAEVHVTAIIDGSQLFVTAHEFSAAMGMSLTDVIVGELRLGPTDSLVAKNYTARIDWGDGAFSAAQLLRVGDKLLVAGSHRYIQAGQFQTTVLVEDGPVVTRTARNSAVIRVAHAYEGGRAVDLFEGMLGQRTIPFDSLTKAQDVVQWNRQNGVENSWSSAFQTWDSYRGFADLTEDITWGDGATNSLRRTIPYYTFETAGSFGSFSAWGWGNGYLWGWNTGENEANGWWGSSGSFDKNALYWYHFGWYGWGGWGDWPGGFGWGAYGWNGYFGWDGYYDWGYVPLSNGVGVDGWPYYNFGSDSGSNHWVAYGGVWDFGWSYDLTPTSGRFDSNWYWSTWYGGGFDTWQSAYYAYDWAHSGGTTQHVFEDQGAFSVGTTFGLSRTFQVAEAVVEAVDVRPVVAGFEDEALSDVLLANFITSDWDSGIDGLSAEVDWGDGSSTTLADLVVMSDQRLAVRGEHTYAEEGDYQITIALRGRAGMSRVLRTQATIVDKTLTATAADIFALEDENTGQIMVATIDSFHGDVKNLAATIDWGDQAVPPIGLSPAETHYLSRGEIKRNATSGKYEVWGQHTYALGPTAINYYDVRIEINDQSPQPLVVESQARVASGWTATAQARHQGFGESHTLALAGGLVSSNTGELLLQHELDFDLSPGTAVGGDPRLVFNSATTNPRPIIQAVLASAEGSQVPTHFEARLIWDHQEPTPWTTYEVQTSPTGTDYLIAVQTPTPVRQTGVYDWTIEVRIYTNLDKPLSIAESGQSVVVVQNWADVEPADPFEISPPLGMGWHLSTVERLFVEANGDVIYVNGLGFPRLFKSPELHGVLPYQLTGPVNEFGELQFDPQGRSFVYTSKDQIRKHFNSLGLMYWIERPGLPSEFHNYDELGRLVSIRTIDGAQTNFEYTGMRVSSIQQPGGRGVGLSYSTDALLRITEATGQRQFEYYQGNLVGTQWGLLSSNFAYGTHGRVFQVGQGLGSLYQIFPAAVQGLQPQAQTTAQDVTLFVDPLGRQHWYSLDSAGRILGYSGPGAATGLAGQIETWERDDRFQIASHTGPLGTSTFGFDDQGNLTTHNSLGQGTTTFAYDTHFNRPRSTVDPNGYATHYQLDSQTGMISQISNAAGGLVSNVYAGGLLMATLGLNGATTTYQYDAQRRLVAELGPQFRNRYQTYDNAGNLRTYQDANGAVTTFQYDARNRLIAQTDAMGNSTLFTYDPSGLLIAKVDPNGRRTQFTYDQRGFQISISEGVGSSLQRTSTVTYDVLGNPTVERDPQGFVTSHTYDARHRRTSTLDPGGGVTQYFYDQADQLVEILDRAGRTWGYHYDALGRQIGATDPLGRTTTRRLGWTGNVIAEVDAAGRTTTHAYDALYRRIATAFNDQVTQFEYDPAGNLVRSTDPLGRQSIFSYDLLNHQVARQDPQGHSWITSYDPEGNAVGTLDPLGRTTFTTYDALSRPTEHIDAGGNLLQWSYDELGNVTGVRDGRGNWTTSTFDLHSRRIAETDAWGLSDTFQFDLRDALVASFDKFGRPTRYTSDPLGQTIAIQDPSQAVWQFSYDMAGNTTGQRDPLGRVTLNGFDAAGRLISTQDPLGNHTQVTYDVSDNVLSMTDPLGRITSFGYDDFNRRTTTVDPLGHESSWVYDAVGNVLTETRPLARVTHFVYDALDRPTQTTDALGGQTHFTYDAVGNLASQTDALGHNMSYGYDALNRRTRVVDALGQVSTAIYDATGNVTSTTDPLGRVSSMSYDALNRLESTVDPVGGITRYAYDFLGNRLSIKNAAGETQAFSYDELKRLVSTKSRDMGTRYISYDAVGNAIATTDGNGLTFSTTYDALNRPIATTDPVGYASRVVYDAVGNVVETIDPLGHATRTTYDALNRPLTSTDPLNFQTSFTYDAVGNRISLTDPIGNVTAWSYDLLDRVTTETNPLGHELRFAYDAVGNRTSLTKRDGQVIAMAYDPLRRMTEETWFTDGSPVQTLSFAYDAASQLQQVADGATTLSWLYDGLGRIAAETQLLSAEITARLAGTYDPVGRRTQAVASINGAVDSTLDARLDRGGRVTRIEQTGPNVTPKSVSFAYDEGGRRISSTRFANVARTQVVAETSTSFDMAGRPNGLYHAWDESLFAAYQLNWDAGSRLTSVDSLLDGLSSFTYDDSDQLTAADYTQYPDLSFSYDANGNRIGGGYATGVDNQLLSNGESTFAYDLNGNLISRTAAATGAVVEYAYDHRDRLTDVRYRTAVGGALTKQVHYAYDPLDRRVSQSVDSDGDDNYERTEFFVNDGLRASRDGAGDSLLLRLDPSGNVLARYLHGLAVDEVLAEENIDPSTGEREVLWMIADHQGSIRDIVRYDSAANHAAIVDHIFYDAFGQVVFESDVNVEHVFGYTGREWDAESDLQYSRRRYYDPGIARFTSRDPLSFAAGDLNLYRYTGNHPTYATDPSGLDDIVIKRLLSNPSPGDHLRAWSDYWSERGRAIWNGERSTFIGRRQGDWIYVNRGGRATITAVEKAAKSLENATAEQIQDRINGIRSPFRISDSSLEIGIFFGGTNQHIHDIGNVERLYNLFRGTKFYHGGIAHPVDYTAETISGANGWGFEAGIARALKDVLAYYRPGSRISIYGWSRGAAQSIELARDLEALGIPVEFLGVFDPVYSIGSAGHGSAYIDDESMRDNYVSIGTPSNVRVATAIYAMNEDRSWFPATRLRPNGKTQLNLIGSPGAHGEVGGHWQSNMPIQQLNLRAMIEFARGHGNVTFAWQGIDPQIQDILSSEYGQSIALRRATDESVNLELRAQWLRAAAANNWNPYTRAQYQTQLFSTVAEDWNPGGFGTQNWDAINVIAVIRNASLAGRLVAGKQPLKDHYPRVLPWLELGLWDVYPGMENARPFIESLYEKRINPSKGGWK